ncbi:hypothetical protein ABPG77_005920 [Micractinium sp. CCAP 211/92]
MQLGALTGLADLTLEAWEASAEGFAPLRALSGTLRRLHVDTTDTVWPPFLSEVTALVALRIVNGNCMDVEDEEQSLKSLEAALTELTSLTVLELIDVVSGVPPAGQPAQRRRPSLYVEFASRQQPGSVWCCL